MHRRRLLACTITGAASHHLTLIATPAEGALQLRCQVPQHAFAETLVGMRASASVFNGEVERLALQDGRVFGCSSAPTSLRLCLRAFATPMLLSLVPVLGPIVALLALSAMAGRAFRQHGLFSSLPLWLLAGANAGMLIAIHQHRLALDQPWNLVAFGALLLGVLLSWHLANHRARVADEFFLAERGDVVA